MQNLHLYDFILLVEASQWLEPNVLRPLFSAVDCMSLNLAGSLFPLYVPLRVKLEGYIRREHCSEAT